MLGTLKSVAVAPAELDGAFEEGIGFDGSAIEGFARASESDMLARPDPATFQILPEPDGRPADSARMFCDITDARRLAVVGRPALRAAPGAVQGGRARLHLLHPPRDRVLPAEEPADGRHRAGADRQRRLLRHDQPRHARTTSGAPPSPRWRRSASRSSSATTRSRPGQQEIDLRYADALSMADNIMTFRHVIKEVAIAHGAHATFMPKPFRHQPGSGMHTHLSLFEGDRNAFHDPSDELNLSKTARAFIAGPACATPARSPRSRTSG